MKTSHPPEGPSERAPEPAMLEALIAEIRQKAIMGIRVRSADILFVLNQLRVEQRASQQIAQQANPPCQGCGGPHPFDTTVPSVQWNAVVRKAGLPEYLCLTCIVSAFVNAGESFTAELVGGEHSFEPIEVRTRSQNAIDAQKLSEENTRLRAELCYPPAATPEVKSMSAVLTRWALDNHDEAKDTLGHQGAFESCPYPMCQSSQGAPPEAKEPR